MAMMRTSIPICSSGVWKHHLAPSQNVSHCRTGSMVESHSRRFSSLCGIGFCSFDHKHLSGIAAFQPSFVRRAIQCRAEDQQTSSDAERGGSQQTNQKRRVVFLGSPEVCYPGLSNRAVLGHSACTSEIHHHPLKGSIIHLDVQYDTNFISMTSNPCSVAALRHSL